MATTEWRASIDDALIQKIKEDIVQRFHPKRIVLFGSHARGEAGPDSDLDLMIEMETNLPQRARVRLVDSAFANRRWPMDLVVFTPEEVAANRDIRGTLLYTIEREGKVLYAQ